MHLRRKDVDMAEKFGDMEFILYGGYSGELVEGLATFNYLERPLDQTDNYLP